LVGYVYTLAPFVMADRRLAWQMPQRCCNMFSYYCVNYDSGITDTLPSVHHLLRQWFFNFFAYLTLLSKEIIRFSPKTLNGCKSAHLLTIQNQHTLTV